MDDIKTTIESELYQKENDIIESLPDTSNKIIDDLDSMLTDKVRRYTLKGQLDGN